MRIILITDSLGMPRDKIDVKDTWPSLFINKFKDKHEIFTFMQRARDSNQIVGLKEEFFSFYKPDLVILQFGIVDCCRRALPENILGLISRIPLFSKIIRYFLRKYHYRITKLYDSKRVSPVSFKNNILNIAEELESKNIKAIFIAIAEPGDFLVNKIYHVKEDIKEYNNIMSIQLNNKKKICYINPFKEDNPKLYTLKEDGHHLNPYGHYLVIQTLENILKEDKFFI